MTTTGTASVPYSERLRTFVKNVKAHPGEIESTEHAITTPIAWDGLGHSIFGLGNFEKAADELDQLAQQNVKLKAFAKAIAEHFFDHLDMDGGDFHDLALQHGVVVETEVTSPCVSAGPENDYAGCRCAEYGDFPQTCYRLSPDLEVTA